MLCLPKWDLSQTGARKVTQPCFCKQQPSIPWIQPIITNQHYHYYTQHHTTQPTNSMHPAIDHDDDHFCLASEIDDSLILENVLFNVKGSVSAAGSYGSSMVCVSMACSKRLKHMSTDE